jgi:hypothetical protein
MINNENSYCLKLISNSGNKINKNQIAVLGHKFHLPIEFIVDALEWGYSMVWFTLIKDDNVYSLNPIAYQFSVGNILDFFSDNIVSSTQKRLIDNFIQIKVPKIDVIADDNYLIKINRYTESKKYLIVLKNFEWENFNLTESKVNWKKTIRIDIRKYNQDQLKIIAKQFQLLDWCLLYLKKVKAICVYWDTTKPYFLAFQLKEDSPIFSEEKYKGLNLWNSFYFYLTKKEKDKLLKIPATNINTKKAALNKDTKSTIKNYVNLTHLNLDSILDKIISSGLNSLSKEERNFLDNESKKD